MLLLLSSLLACAPSPLADDPATACNEANEACEPGLCAKGAATMTPGADCMSCHTQGAGYDLDYAKHVGMEQIPWFTVAGTVYVDADGTAPAEGALVRVTGAEGDTLELTTNGAGNFFTMDAVSMPFSAEVEVDGEVAAMQGAQESGSCNVCHACDGAAASKLHVP